MNQNIKYHLGQILISLAGIGTELLGSAPAEIAAPAVTGEPTDQQPTRTRKARTAVASAETKTETQPSGETKTETPASTIPPADGPKGKTWEELKEIGRPMVMGVKNPDGSWKNEPQGTALKALVDKYLPEDQKGQGLKSLANFPQHHEDFMRDVEASLI